MALLKGIYMTDVHWYNGYQWMELMAVRDSTEVSAKTGYIILTRQDTPYDAPEGTGVTVNFSRLEMLKAGGVPEVGLFNVFHAGGIPPATKSPIIRYKIAVGTWSADEEIIITNPTYHYMMLNASFPTNAYAGGNTITAVGDSSRMVMLKFYFPAFTTSHLSATELTLFRSLLGVASNWSVTNSGGGRTQTVTPASVDVAEVPTVNEITDYGLAKILVGLNLPLSFPVSGTYTLSTTFKSNDGDPASQLPGTHTITATIAVNMGSTTPFVCSLDDDVTMFIDISQS